MKVGDVLFMSSPADLTWPKTFPEESWMFGVEDIRNGRLQGHSVNWKRKGKGTWVARDPDEVGFNYDKADGLFHGLRHATTEEVNYFFKRAPEYKKYLNGGMCNENE